MPRQRNRGGAQSVGALTEIVSSSFTRPANATQFTAGDVVGNTGTAAVMTFADCAQAVGGSGTIVSGLLLDGANPATKLDAELWLFSVAPTAVADNAAFAPSDAELASLVGIVPFPVADWFVGKADVGADGNAVCLGSKGVFPFACASGDTDLYGVLVARNTYTPVSGGVFTVKLAIQQD